MTNEPLDIASVTEKINEEYVKNIASTDLTTEVRLLLEKDAELLDTAEKQQKKSRTIEVTKSGDSFSIKETDMRELMEEALPGYMDPYAAVADVFDMRDFIEAYLDACFKGDTERYILHTEVSVEDAAAWYEEAFQEFQIDDFSAEQNERFQDAAKRIFANCRYSVGITKRNSLTEYVFELTTTPNISFISAADEMEAGTYYSQEEAREAFLSVYDKYAAESSYGEEKKISVTWNTLNMLNDRMDDADYNSMIDAIIPAE